MYWIGVCDVSATYFYCMKFPRITAFGNTTFVLSLYTLRTPRKYWDITTCLEICDYHRLRRCCWCLSLSSSFFCFHFDLARRVMSIECVMRDARHHNHNKHTLCMQRQRKHIHILHPKTCRIIQGEITAIVTEHMKKNGKNNNKKLVAKNAVHVQHSHLHLHMYRILGIALCIENYCILFSSCFFYKVENVCNFSTLFDGRDRKGVQFDIVVNMKSWRRCTMYTMYRRTWKDVEKKVMFVCHQFQYTSTTNWFPFDGVAVWLLHQTCFGISIIFFFCHQLSEILQSLSCERVRK